MRKLKLYITIIVAGIVLLLLSAWVKDQFSIKAIYLVQGQGELDQGELAKHPEIVVTRSFEKFKGYAKQRVALWIDKNALTMVDPQWFKFKPQLFYPIVLVGYGDDNYSFANMLLGCQYFEDQFTCGSPNELSAYRPDPGFSVIQLTEFNPPPGYLGFPRPTGLIFKQGYRYKPHVEDILTITNGLLHGTLKQPTAAPTLPPAAISTVPTPTLPF